MPLKLTNKSWISVIRSGRNPVEYLFNIIGPTNCDSNGNTLLHYAAYLGDYDLCKVLLSEGWFVLQKNTYGETALDYGVSHQLVKEVLDAEVRNLPPRVLDFALSSHSEELKRKSLQMWRMRFYLSLEPKSDSFSEPKESLKYQRNFSGNSESESDDSTAGTVHYQDNKGHFSPINMTSDLDATDWTVPEDLISDLGGLLIDATTDDPCPFSSGENKEVIWVADVDPIAVNLKAKTSWSEIPAHDHQFEASTEEFFNRGHSEEAIGAPHRVDVVRWEGDESDQKIEAIEFIAPANSAEKRWWQEDVRTSANRVRAIASSHSWLSPKSSRALAKLGEPKTKLDQSEVNALNYLLRRCQNVSGIANDIKILRAAFN